jgi:hypothetical protein
MGQPLTQHSFRGGEIAAEFYGNTRNPLHGMSLRTCKNFLPLVDGGLVNRAGTFHRGGLKSSEVRFEVFVFSDAQAFVLEFTAGVVRFWTPAGQVLDGLGNPYELVAPYTADDLPYLKFAQEGDVVTVTKIPYAPREISRISNTNWTIAAVSFTPQAYFAGAPYVGASANGAVVDGELGPYGAVAPPYWKDITTFADNDLVLYRPGAAGTPVHMYVSTGDGNLAHQPDTSPAWWADVTFGIVVAPGVIGYKKGAYVWQSTNDYDGLVYISLNANNTQTPAAGSLYWASATDTTRVPKEWQIVIVQRWKDSLGVERSTLPSSPTQVNLKLAAETDRPARVAWGVESAGPASYTITGYDVFAGRNGLYGLIGSTPPGTRTFFWDGSSPDYGIQPPKGTDPFATPSGHSYPAVVAYDNAQRRVYARTDAKPSSLFGSALDNFDDFDVNFPQQDSDSYEWKLASKTLQEIRSLAEFGQLCAFTGQGEWSMQGVDGKGITANNVQARKHSSHGSGWLDPAETEHALLFVTTKGKLRDFYFDYNANKYVGRALWRIAQHLFRGRTPVSMAFQRDPYGILWIAFDDGALVSVTYDLAAGVAAWAQHPTKGTVVQVACIPNGTEDALMLGVVRNGTGRMEIMASRDYIPDVREACFLDAALQFDGRNTNGALEMKVTGVYTGGGEVTVLASAASFAAGDVGDRLVILPDGIPATYDDDGEVLTEAIEPTSIEITVFTDPTHVTGILSAPLPAEFQATPTSKWGWARDTITGLSHLEGLEVMVLADANVQGPFPVAGGQITLKPPALIATVGLRYNSDAELLDIASDAVKPNVKAVSRVVLQVVGSRGIEAGETFEPPDDDFDAETDLMPAKLREVTDDFDPTELVTGQVEVPIGSTWNTGGRACIRQKDPLPLTITSVTRDVEVGGRGG